MVKTNSSNPVSRDAQSGLSQRNTNGNDHREKIQMSDLTRSTQQWIVWQMILDHIRIVDIPTGRLKWVIEQQSQMLFGEKFSDDNIIEFVIQHLTEYNIAIVVNTPDGPVYRYNCTPHHRTLIAIFLIPAIMGENECNFIELHTALFTVACESFDVEIGHTELRRAIGILEKHGQIETIWKDGKQIFRRKVPTVESI